MSGAGAVLAPAAVESPLLGFTARLGPAERYAIYPLGAYTRACVEDLPAGSRIEEDACFLGFVDDRPAQGTFLGRPVATLREAASWPLRAILLMRDTQDRALARRIGLLREEGLLDGVRVIDQPAPSLEAMTAHLGTYHPGCGYEAEFVEACRAVDRPLPGAAGARSVLACTMDAEMFPAAGPEEGRRYVRVMRELCRVFDGEGFSFSLCVQLRDTPGGMQRTPDGVVEAVIAGLGSDCIELHGLDHSMPVAGYDAEWFGAALDELERRFGARCRYWAAPGWTVSWRTLRSLARVPAIRAMRGVWTGVNCRQPGVVETYRWPYQVQGRWQIPYSYVDWMFMDAASRALDTGGIPDSHRRLAEFAARGPCLLESIAHPYRLVGTDWRDRLAMVRRTLAEYSRLGVTIQSVSRSGGDVWGEEAGSDGV
jgi:hypothetical protein